MDYFLFINCCFHIHGDYRSQTGAFVFGMGTHCMEGYTTR
jgi:hypothetical protein